MGMVLLLGGYVITALGIALASHLGNEKSKKRKFILWGVILMVLISAPLSISMGFTLAFILQNGWATGIIFYLFPIGFITGLAMLLVGIFKKEESEETL